MLKSKPITFTGPEVRAILAGAKTQFRRPIALPWWSTQDWKDFEEDAQEGPCTIARKTGCLSPIPCPFDFPGKKLWVKETWGLANTCPEGDSLLAGDWLQLGYRANGRITGPTNHPAARVKACHRQLLAEMRQAGISGDGEECRVAKWRPASGMPQWASRILLEVTSVYTERLQEINQDSARAEGLYYTAGIKDQVAERAAGFGLASLFYNEVWDDNPWVWVINFKRV